MTIELGPLADRLTQAHIIIPIDLSRVARLEAGVDFSLMADGGIDLVVMTVDADVLRVQAEAV